MSNTMRSVLTSPDAPGAVVLAQRDRPTAGDGDVLIKVERFSLNRGELNFARNKPEGSPIGWDVAGVVERSASNGRLAVGQRVVAMVRAQQGWAEQVAVPDSDVAAIPDGITAEQAATLPVAAGTALACIDAAGPGVLGRRVLVTGATGGVGNFAIQIAKAAGAHVTAQVRRDEQADGVRALGAHDVIVTTQGDGLDGIDKFRLVIDGLGGPLLGACLGRLEQDGLAVNYGVTAGAGFDMPLGALLGNGRASLRGLNLYAVSEVEAPKIWLGRLLALVSGGAVRAPIERRASWSEVGQLATDLMERRFRGKAVLSVD